MGKLKHEISHRLILNFDTPEALQFMLQKVKQAEKEWEVIKHRADPQDQSIDALDISAKLKNFLKREGLLTLQQIIDEGSGKLLRLPNMGKATIVELRKALALRGFELKKDS